MEAAGVGVEAAEGAEYLLGSYRLGRALLQVTTIERVPFANAVRAAQIVTGVMTEQAVDDSIEAENQTTTLLANGGTLVQNWVNGTFLYTAGAGGGSLETANGIIAFPAGQQVTGTYTTGFGQTTQLWDSANAATTFIDANGLDTCMSCSWSGQLQE
jgi:hypothetical protein